MGLQLCLLASPVKTPTDRPTYPPCHLTHQPGQHMPRTHHSFAPLPPPPLWPPSTIITPTAVARPQCYGTAHTQAQPPQPSQLPPDRPPLSTPCIPTHTVTPTPSPPQTPCLAPTTYHLHPSNRTSAHAHQHAPAGTPSICPPRSRYFLKVTAVHPK